MERLPQEHQRVHALVKEMHEQRKKVGKQSSFVGFMNMEWLKSQLYECGWIARLREDEETIFLEPVPGQIIT